MSKKIGVKELFALFALTIGIRLSDGTPSLLFQKTYTATWMVPILIGIIFFPSLWVLIFLMQKYRKGLSDLIIELMGKPVGIFICIILFIYMLLITSTDSKNYIEILSSFYFPQTPSIILYTALIVTCTLIALGGPLTIGRTAWVVFPYIQIMLIILITLTWKSIHPLYLFPILGNGIGPTLQTSLMNSSIYGEMIIFALFVPFFKNVDVFKKASLISIIFITGTMSVFFVLYTMNFGGGPLEHLLLPFQTLTHSASLGRFLSNFDAYFLAFWLVASYIRFAMYLYVLTFLFSRLIRVDDTRFFLWPLSCLVILMGSIPSNITQSAFYFREEVMMPIGTILLLVLPFLLWLVSIIREKVEKFNES